MRRSEIAAWVSLVTGLTLAVLSASVLAGMAYAAGFPIGGSS